MNRWILLGASTLLFACSRGDNSSGDGGPLRPISAVTDPHDDFDRLDGALGSCWTPASTETLAILTNRVGVAAGSVYGIATYATSCRTFTANQYVQATVSNLSGADSLSVWARMSGSGATLTGYQLTADGTTFSGVSRIVNNSGIQLINLSTTSFIAGDIIKMTVEGTAITVFKNGVQIGSAVDSSIANGQPGIDVFDSASDGSPNTFIDNFVAGQTSLFDTVPPAVTITTNGGANFSTATASVSLGGTASDAVGVTSCSWQNVTTAVAGAATGTTSWTTPSIALNPGANTLTVKCQDAALNVGTATIAVTYSPPGSTSIIATSRSGTWSGAGATIVDRSVVCATLNPGVTVDDINNAIAACGVNQVVQLGTGTFNISGGILIQKDNVTLRGNGPNNTIIAFSGYELCGGLGAGICIMGNGLLPAVPDMPRNLANWTGGFAKGSTSITLDCTGGNCASQGLQVGSTIFLDQLDDTTPDFYGIANCANRVGPQTAWCAGEGANGLSMGSTRVQNEEHLVTAVSGNTVTLAEPVQWPNFVIGKTPQAWWGSTLPISGVGIENLTLDATNDGCGAWYNSCGGILFVHAKNGWAKNVSVHHMSISQIKLYESVHMTIRDSYIHSSKTPTSSAYGVVFFYSSFSLVENNIIQNIVGPVLTHGVANVVGYNYTRDDTYNPRGDPFPPGNLQMQAGLYQHNGGIGYTLWEGNISSGFKADAIHGTSNLSTVFRNRLNGYENQKTNHTNPIFVYSWNRYFNIIGNVLGEPTIQDTYDGPFNDSTIFRLGETPNYCPWNGTNVPADDCTDIGAFTDTRVPATMMRWGNWDTVTGERFSSTEVPSTDANYPNAMPTNNNLPSSFYLAGAQTFMNTPWGTPPFPAIGVDVVGGDILGVDGHAYSNAAKRCYDNLAHVTVDQIALISNFNASSCYYAATGDTTPGR